jgi:hypothetical protein
VLLILLNRRQPDATSEIPKLSRGHGVHPGSQVLEVANRSDDVDHEQRAKEPRQNDVWVGHCGDLSRLMLCGCFLRYSVR